MGWSFCRDIIKQKGGIRPFLNWSGQILSEQILSGQIASEKSDLNFCLQIFLAHYQRKALRGISLSGSMKGMDVSVK